MTNAITLKTQEEWLAYFKELAKEHGEMLAQPLVDYFADKILLTKKEVEEAREDWKEWMWPAQERFSCFLDYRDYCEHSQDEAICRLCKKLTQFVEEEVYQ